MPKHKRLTAAGDVEVAIQQILALAAQTIKRIGTNEQALIVRPFAAPTWALHYRTPKLYAATASGIALTGQGRLILSQALRPGGKGVSVEKLLPFADDDFEQVLFRLLHEANPGVLAGWEDPLKALFYFKVLHIPVICRRLLSVESLKAGSGTLWLGALSAYSVAFERVLLERLFRAAYQQQKAQLQGAAMEMWANRSLGTTIDNWFEDTPEGPLFWLFRFTQWRDYALRSLIYFFREQSIDIRRMTGNLKEAALLGVLKRLGDLPEERCSELLSRVHANREARKVFLKNARKRLTSPSSVKLDTFLIECWPVVMGYGWSYRDLQRVQDHRFNKSNVADDSLILTPRDLKERCAKLGLSLGSLGRSKVGRSKADTGSKLPPLYELALSIDSLGGNPTEWFWGRAEAGFHSL